MDPFLQILKSLAEKEARFVIIGGVAAVLHGSPTVTQDLDIVAPFDVDNLERIVAVFRDLNPRYRMHPNKPPLPMDVAELSRWRNLYMLTTLGQIDILGELPHFGRYEEILDKTVMMNLGGFSCRVLDIDTLIACKTKAARLKDRAAVAELEIIRKRRNEGGDLFKDL